jgi:hypothetical protein
MSRDLVRVDSFEREFLFQQSEVGLFRKLFQTGPRLKIFAKSTWRGNRIVVGCFYYVTPHSQFVQEARDAHSVTGNTRAIIDI